MGGGVLRANTGSGTFFKTDRHRLLLSAGINRITVEAAAATPVRLDRISVSRATGGPRAQGVPLTLTEGRNTITLYNDPANGPTAERCPPPGMPVLDSPWAPNLDKFEIAPVHVE